MSTTNSQDQNQATTTPAPSASGPTTTPDPRRSIFIRNSFVVTVVAIIAVIALAIHLRTADVAPASPVATNHYSIVSFDGTEQYLAHYEELRTIRPSYFHDDAIAVAIDASSLRQFIPLSPFTNYGGAITDDGTVFLLGYGDATATTPAPNARSDSEVVLVITGLHFPEEWRSHCFWVYPYTSWESYLVYDYDVTVPHNNTEGGQGAGLWSYSSMEGCYLMDEDLSGEIYYLSPPNLPTSLT